MIYRILRSFAAPCIDIENDIAFDQDLHPAHPEYGNSPFFGVHEIKPYADVWGTQHIQFLTPAGEKTDEFPDLDAIAGKLFLNEKAYGVLSQLLMPHGEFLPVTFNAGTGYIFNALKNVEPINKQGYDIDETYEFKESKETPIFKSDIRPADLYITTEVYRAIKLNGLKGLGFYQDYSAVLSEPEGGYKGSTSMPGYENEA